MDCNTARLLLEFARPGAAELDARESNELAGHLDHCPDCNTAARTEKRLDDWLGRAMRQVEVPGALRANVVARLHAGRTEWYRQRIGHYVRFAAAAAAVVFVVWGAIRWSQPAPTVLDLDGLCQQTQEFRVSMSQEKVQEWLRELGTDVPAPADLRYQYLAMPPAMAKLQGRDAPVLYFHDPTNADRTARVYILSAKKNFDLKKLPTNFSPQGGYDDHVEVVSPSDGIAFLTFYTGDNLVWLKMPAGN